MDTVAETGSNSPVPVDIKVVPASADVRRRIRAEALRLALGMDRRRPLTRESLESLGARLLARLGLDGGYLGFAMVALNNEFWRDQYAGVPTSRRLILLPHCLRNAEVCRGTYSSLGLACAGCGACELMGLRREAEELGYRVLIMEGTPAVVEIILAGGADAILGVACLDSLDHAFSKVAQMGVPHAAVPLLVDGCVDTEAELDMVREWMRLEAGTATSRTRSYLPLLIEARQLFEEKTLNGLLAPALAVVDRSRIHQNPVLGTQAIAMDWLRVGGKRFRPFITLAGYAALAHGGDALRAEADLSSAFPTAVRRFALGIEALHKASLIHDDIEDQDLYRYGRETLHRRWGVPTAINVGDYLVGFGYQCITSGADELGAACVADILGCMTGAHLKLCWGQGGELLCQGRDPRTITPVEVQTIYALKTAPAFLAAMYTGLRAAVGDDGGPPEPAALKPYCRYVGVAYQVANDLKDWDRDAHDKLVSGQDLISGRPTILRAFAHTTGEVDPPAAELTRAQRVERLRQIYTERGVFAKARRLVEQYKQCALAEAEKADPPELGELMHFVAETIL